MRDWLSRRAFLAATSVVGLGLGGRVAMAMAPPRIGFGFSLYGMKSLTLSQALRVCAEIGYSGVELACLKGWPGDPAALSKADRIALRSELDGRALDLPCLMENLSLVVADEQHRSNLERLKAAFQLGHDLCPDAAPVVETVLGGKPGDWESVRERMVEKLRDWERVAAAHKTIVAIKAHAFGSLHTPQDAKWLVRQVASPWIRLVYDYSHFQRQNLDLKDSLTLMLPDTVFVHIKDNVTKDGKTEFALPGDAGDINYVDFLKQLRDGGYRGSVVVEVSAQVFGKAGYDPVAAARRSYKNIQPAFVQAGLRAEL